MTNRKRMLWGVAVLCGLTPCAVQAQLTHAEDTLVRQTYARAAMASQVGATELAIVDTPAQYAARAAKHTLKYEIISVSGGEFSTILSTPIARLETFDTGHVIDVGASKTSYTEMKTATTPEKVTYEQVAFPKWRQQGPIPSAWLSLAVADLVQAGAISGVTRYAEANVNVTLDGVSRAYSALFLFDGKGHTEVLDQVANPAAFLSQSTFPHILLETRRRNEANVTKWVEANQVAGCTADGKSECCDLPSMRCGVTPEDVHTTALKLGPGQTSVPQLGHVSTNGTPLTCSDLNYVVAPCSITIFDYNGHATGNHGFTDNRREPAATSTQGLATPVSRPVRQT